MRFPLKDDREKAKEFLYEYFLATQSIPELFDAWRKFNMIVGIKIEDLDIGFTLDCNGTGVEVSHGYPEESPGAGLTMSSDIFHRLFTGRANVGVVFAKRQIKTTGNVTSILKIAGLMPKNVALYREFLKQKGLA